jgi:hypothetical protein
MLPELEEDLNVLWAFVNEMSTLEDFDHCIKEFKDWETQKLIILIQFFFQ